MAFSDPDTKLTHGHTPLTVGEFSRDRKIKVRAPLARVRSPLSMQCLGRLAEDTLRGYETCYPISTVFRWVAKLLSIMCGKLPGVLSAGNKRMQIENIRDLGCTS